MLRRDDRGKLLRGDVDLVVDDDVIVESGLAVFLAGSGQAPFDRLGALGPAALQPTAQFLQRGRNDEDLYRLRHLVPDLAGALDLDIEQDVQPLGKPLLHIGARRAVAVGDVLRVLEQLVMRHHLVKASPVDEKVIPSVDLAGPGAARSNGSGKADVLPLLHRPGDDRAFSRAGGPGDHEQLPSLTHSLSPLPLCSFHPGARRAPRASAPTGSRSRCP